MSSDEFLFFTVQQHLGDGMREDMGHIKIADLGEEPRLIYHTSDFTVTIALRKDPARTASWPSVVRRNEEER